MPNNNSKTLLYAGGILLAAAVLIFFAVLPELSRLAGLRAGIMDAESRIGLAVSRMAELEAARAELTKIENERVRLAALFPEREYMADPVEVMEAAVRAGNGELKLEITDYLEQPVKSAGSGEKPKERLVPALQEVEEVPFTTTLTSDWRGLVNFFRYLESNEALIKFSSVMAVAEKEDSETDEAPPRNTGRAETTMDGVLFMRKK